MDCLRNHGPRMKFRLGHAKVNNPPRSEAVSRGEEEKKEEEREEEEKKKRQRFSSYSHVLFAGSRGCWFGGSRVVASALARFVDGAVNGPAA